jgi:hypothetical protein
VHQGQAGERLQVFLQHLQGWTLTEEGKQVKKLLKKIFGMPEVAQATPVAEPAKAVAKKSVAKKAPAKKASVRPAVKKAAPAPAKKAAVKKTAAKKTAKKK